MHQCCLRQRVAAHFATFSFDVSVKFRNYVRLPTLLRASCGTPCHGVCSMSSSPPERGLLMRCNHRQIDKIF
eukprot:jgi/Mesvir1/21408/Mv25936-RA.1